MVFILKQYLFRKILAIKYGIKFKSNVLLNKNVRFEGGNAIFSHSEFVDSSMGFGSYIANHSTIRKTKIGRYCAIGDYVRTGMGIHPTSGFVSVHPAFFSLQETAGFTYTNKQLFEEHKFVDKEKKYYVEIGNDVWIGNNVNIIDGITIGDGAVIATGAVVTKDIEPYAIYGGIPAKLIKYRFSQEIIGELLQIKWWEKDRDWIKKHWKDFEDIAQFLKSHANNGIKQ